MKMISPLVCIALALSCAAPSVQAQGLTREQVKMERDAFLAMMRWDELTGMWVLRQGMEPPKGVMSRAEVIAMRDQFLRMNVYDDTVGSWVPVKAPRDMSTLTRDQVNMETLRFLMTHRYDEQRNEWVSKSR